MHFSVIIPVYNVALYLHSCLDSIAMAMGHFGAEADCQVEVLCVDDGSMDGSAEILDEYSRRQGFRVIHQTNSGVSTARNHGLEAASGDWICFVDGDDLVKPIYFAELLNAISRSDADIIRFSHRRYDEVFNEQVFKKIAPTTDDLWFWAMTVLAGRKIRRVVSGLGDYFPCYFANQSASLWSVNIDPGEGNDKQLKAILDAYPVVLERLLGSV